MLYRVISKEELPQLLDAFLASYEVIAPVKTSEGFVFDVVRDSSLIVLHYDSTLNSLKKFFLPHDETLMTFNRVGNEVEDFVFEAPKRVVFGAHACDINALNRMDLVFKTGSYPDPYYIARRNATLVVGISCLPTETCFCHLWDSDEARFGYDLFLQDIGESYLVSISSVDAANLLESSCTLRLASDEERSAFRHITRLRQDAFNPDIPQIQEVAMLMDAFHSDPFWEELGSRCLSCTACAAVCPTCYCFDLVDQLDPNGITGRRKRRWDCCTAPEFALVAGGHNFRGTPRERVRHRMYHKLNGFLATHDRMLCVGCGRCVTACKANINPIEVLKFFRRKEANNGE